jgi:AhpD family alkylhydroperoxidase
MCLVRADDAAETTPIIRLMTTSDAALTGYLALRSALEHGKLDLRLRELIAILVSEANGCSYSLSANVASARRIGIDEDAITDARHGRAMEARTDAVLRFVDALVHSHGNVTDDELAALRAAGFEDKAIVEIVCSVGFQLLTDYAALCAALPPSDDAVVPHAYES